MPLHCGRRRGHDRPRACHVVNLGGEGDVFAPIGRDVVGDVRGNRPYWCSALGLATEPRAGRSRRLGGGPAKALGPCYHRRDLRRGAARLAAGKLAQRADQRRAHARAFLSFHRWNYRRSDGRCDHGMMGWSPRRMTAGTHILPGSSTWRRRRS
jgi:hypothetical protein